MNKSESRSLLSLSFPIGSQTPSLSSLVLRIGNLEKEFSFLGPRSGAVEYNLPIEDDKKKDVWRDSRQSIRVFLESNPGVSNVQL